MSHNSKLYRLVNSYMRWPVMLIALLLAMDICLYAQEPKTAHIGIVFTLLYAAIVAVLVFKKNRMLSKQLAEFGFRFNQVQRKMLLDLKVPYAMLDREGVILWANDEFRNITGMYTEHRYEIAQFFPNVTKQELEECDDEKSLFYDTGSMQLRLQLKNVVLEEQEEGDRDGKGEIIALYLYDETEIRRLYKESEERCLAVGMIYIDNYEEALEGINEVNGSLLPALVERKINQYMRNNDAVVKKTEKDKFLILFQNKYLNAMKADNFCIMDDVRSLHIGNTVNITISIGIGVCDENNYSFLAAFEAAKLAINRALERGGDQAVVRGDKSAKNNDAEGCSYYGGKSDSVAKSSKVRSRVKTEAICEQIRAAENVLIMGHTKGDADSFGATVGMYRIARQFTDKVNIVLDETMKTVAMLFEQYKSGKSYEEGMFISNAEAMKRADKGTLVIVVDVNAENRTECPEIIPEAGSVVVIDHHREKNPINARVTYAESYASSTCELITEMLQHLEESGKREQSENIIKISESDADVIYAGILLDTNSFITKTGVRTFEAAAYLKRKGADMARVRKCFRKDKSSMYEKARIINSAETYMGKYSFAINDCDSPDEAPTEIGAQVANDLLDVAGVIASFVFTLYDDVVYVSARAMDEANVELIMNRCGGGGHLNIAGAQFRDMTVEEAMTFVKDKIKEMTEKGEI